jgi:hypothetical protein
MSNKVNISGQLYDQSGLTFPDNDREFRDAWIAPVDGVVQLDPVKVHKIMVGKVLVERERRLSLGFDYDFADARGVHRIGTTPQDMVGWRDVIDYANALIDTGDTTTQITIVTDTGPAVVTAPEWQSVMLQAAVVRQQLWASSFALMAMSPIPEDYIDDAYWT